jgi:hypothetical protein
MGSLYFNGSACIDMAPVLTNQSISSQNAFEILNKSLPYSSTSIVNDAKLLMTDCAGSSNGFACLCNSNSTITYSSLCYLLNSSLVTMPLTVASFGLTNTSYSTSYLQLNAGLLLLLSELPNYNWIYSPSTTELISND